MSAQDLVAELRRRGVRLFLLDGRPRLEPPELLTPADWSALAAVRGELPNAIREEVPETPGIDPGWEHHHATRSECGYWIRKGLSAQERRDVNRPINFFEPEEVKENDTEETTTQGE